MPLRSGGNLITGFDAQLLCGDVAYVAAVEEQEEAGGLLDLFDDVDCGCEVASGCDGAVVGQQQCRMVPGGALGDGPKAVVSW